MSGSYDNGKQPRVLLFSIDITYVATSTQFAICVLGVFLCYFIYGVLQEFIFKMEGFEYGLSLTFFQFVVYSVLTWLQLPRGSGMIPNAKAPMYFYGIIGFLSISTMALSNISCQYLNYPTQVVFKSSKLLPVMLVGVLYLKKKYKALDYLAVILLTIGIIVCSLASKSTGDVTMKFDQFGIILISCALFADAFIGNVQEKVLTMYNSSTIEMMFFSKLIGAFLLLIVVLIKGELFAAISFLVENNLILHALAFSAFGCIGEVFVMTLVKLFGALITVITTSCRKVVTIIFSFVLFPKPISFFFILGVLLVSSGIGLNVYAKQQQKLKHVVEPPPQPSKEEIEMDKVLDRV